MSHATDVQILELVKEVQTEMRLGFAEMDRRFVGVDERFATIDQRFDTIDERFAAMDRRFVGVDERFAAMDKRFDTIDESFAENEEKHAEMESQIHDSRTELKSFFNERMDRLEAKIESIQQDNKIFTGYFVDHHRRIVKLEKWRASV